MFGFQEIAILVGIVLAIIFLPRLQGRTRRPAVRQEPATAMSGKLRSAIAVSVVYPLAVAPLLKPWQNDPLLFAYIGLGPVAIGWLARWVWLGFNRK